MRKKLAVEKIFLSAILIASLLAFAGFLPLRLGALDGIAENVLRDAGADSVTVGGVSVTLWRGVRVKDLRAYKRINLLEEYRAVISRVDIDCNLIGAAFTVMGDPSMLKPGRDLFREAYESPLEFAGDASALAVSFGKLKRVTVRGAGIRFVKKEPVKDRRRQTADTLTVEGVSISGASADISISPKRKALDGVVSVKKAVIPSLAEVVDFKITLRAEDGRLDLTGGSGKMFGGKLSVGLSLDIDSSRILSGGLRLEGMDLEKFCDGTKFAPGRLSGIVNLDTDIEPGSPAVPDSIRASGSASVTRLSVNDLALQRAPAVNQVSKDLRSLRFQEVKSDFHLTSAKVKFDSITAVGDVMRFRSVGWIDFDGKLHQDFAGEFGHEFIARLPRIVRNSLERTEDGGGRFKCRITGTFHKPRVDVDKSVYKRGFRNLFK